MVTTQPLLSDEAGMLRRLDALYKDAFDKLYDIRFQTARYDGLLGRLEVLDTGTVFLTALTAAGSTFAGWKFWASEDGQGYWLVISLAVFVMSVAHKAMRVGEKTRAYSQTYAVLKETDAELKHFVCMVFTWALGGPTTENLETAVREHERLAEKWKNAMAQISRSDVLLLEWGKTWQDQIQTQVDSSLKGDGIT